MDFEHVEAGARRHLGRRDELVAHAVHVSPRHRVGALVAIRPRGRRRRHHRPVAVLQRRVHVLPAELGRALGAGMAELAADFRVGLGVDEIDDAFPRRLVLRRVHARAAGRDAAFRAHAGHLDADEAGAALGALGVMHEVPVGRAAVDRLVLRHRRDHDAVLEPHVAQPERREHRPPGDVVAGAGEMLEPGLRAFEPILVAQPQVLVADALRARQQRIVELHRIEMQIALDVLEPFQRIARRRLQAQHFRAARVFVFRKRRLHGRLAVEIIRHRGGALHRELGARTDGEVRGGGGVAHQHDVFVATTSRRARAGNSATPSRGYARRSTSACGRRDIWQKCARRCGSTRPGSSRRSRISATSPPSIR